MTDTPKVEYTVKEMFEKIYDRIDSIEQALYTRLTTLEQTSASSSAVEVYKRWLFGFGIVLVINIIISFLRK